MEKGFSERFFIIEGALSLVRNKDRDQCGGNN